MTLHDNRRPGLAVGTAFRLEMDNVSETRASGPQGKYRYAWFRIRTALCLIFGVSRNVGRQQSTLPYSTLDSLITLQLATIRRRKTRSLSAHPAKSASTFSGWIDHLAIRFLPSNSKRID